MVNVTTIESACVAITDVLSATCTVKGKVPELAGVPLIVPKLLNDRPVANAPVRKDHVYGG